MFINTLAVIGLLVILGLLGLLLYMIYSDLFGKTKSLYRMLNPIDFKERNVKIAEHQTEYITLPAVINQIEGSVTCCWQFTFMNRLKVLITGKIWSKTFTDNQPFQPVIFTVHKSDVLTTTKSE